MPQVAPSSAVWMPEIGERIDERIKDNRQFIANKLFTPRLRSTNKGTFVVVPTEVFKKTYDTVRAPKAAYNTADYSLARGQYLTEEHAWKETIDDLERADLEQEGVDPDMIAGDRIEEVLTVAKEREAAAIAFNTGIITNTNAVSIPWSTIATATISADVTTASRLIRARTGVRKKMLSLVVNDLVFENMQQNAGIQAKIIYVLPDIINVENLTAPQIAQYLGIREILIGDYMYDSAAGGQAKSLSEIWSSSYALLTLLDDSPDMRAPRFGHSFVWTSRGGTNVSVKGWRTEDPPMDCYAGEWNYSLTLTQSKDSSGVVVDNIANEVSQLLSNITA